MAHPPPQPGQVIRYAYLWWNEARTGLEDGVKDRPCGVVLTRVTESGHAIVYVLPITHTPPVKEEDGIEIPQATKRRLGLDAERSWIVTTEFNREKACPGQIAENRNQNRVTGFQAAQTHKCQIQKRTRRQARSTWA